MTHAEFMSWLAYYRLEPWGEERADLRTGILASTVANCHAGKRSRPFEPKDFMPHFGPPKRMTGEEMGKKFAAFAAMHNARIVAKAVKHVAA